MMVEQRMKKALLLLGECVCADCDMRELMMSGVSEMR